MTAVSHRGTLPHTHIGYMSLRRQRYMQVRSPRYKDRSARRYRQPSQPPPAPQVCDRYAWWHGVYFRPAGCNSRTANT